MSGINYNQEQPVDNAQLQLAVVQIAFFTLTALYSMACAVLEAAMNTPVDYTLIGDNPSITDVFPHFDKDGFGDGGIF